MLKVTLPDSLKTDTLFGQLGATDLVNLFHRMPWMSWEATVQVSHQVKIMSINAHPLGMNACDCLKAQGENDEWKKRKKKATRGTGTLGFRYMLSKPQPSALLVYFNTTQTIGSPSARCTSSLFTTLKSSDRLCGPNTLHTLVATERGQHISHSPSSRPSFNPTPKMQAVSKLQHPNNM